VLFVASHIRIPLKPPTACIAKSLTGVPDKNVTVPEPSYSNLVVSLV